jgi:Domain of unknown function (DUF4169)
MPDIVNFNKARKAKARTDGQAIAAENRVKFGRTKAEKLKARIEAERAERAVDQAKREP